jgi:hypothetical protein
MLAKKIKAYIRPIRRKLFVERVIKVFSWLLVTGLVVSLAVTIVSRFIAIPYLIRWISYIGLGTLSLTLFWSFWLYPSLAVGVKLTDHLGMKERLMTALEFEGVDEESTRIQREDTLRRIENVESRPTYSMSFHRRPWMISGILLLCVFGVAMIQTEKSDQARSIEALQEKIAQETPWIEEKLEEDLLDELLAKEKTIDDMLEALKENIEKATTEEEALKELAMAKNALKDIEEELMEAIEALSMDEMSELSETQASEMMEAVGSIFSEMEASINSSGQNLATKPSISQMAFAGEPGTGTEAGENGDGMAGAGMNPAEGESQGEGPGQGQGEGQGTGSSPTGSTNEAEELQEGASPQGGHHDGADPKEGLYESLYPPERLGGETDPSFIQGDNQKEGERTYSEVQGMPSEAGEFVSYSEILSQYSNDASIRIDQVQVPPIMRNLIKDYFSSLNE